MSQPVPAVPAVRNATIENLVSVLRDQHARKLDVVVPAANLRARDGHLIVAGAEQELTADGVTTVDGRYLPTKVCDEGIGEKLGIPSAYLAKLRATRTDLYDGNVTGLLRGKSINRPSGVETIYPGDDRSFLLRLFRGEDGNAGVARAFLSNGFGGMDNLDGLMAALAGVRASGAEITVAGCDLTDRRMYVDIYAPAVAALAPVLLGGYRNPFNAEGVDRQNRMNDAEYWRGVAAREGQGYAPGTEPIVFAGFRISNSEVGEGAFSITPKLQIKICRNGLVVSQDAIRAVHLGSRLSDGIVQWSHATHVKALELITAKATDAVTQFLDVDYLKRTLVKIEEKAGKPVTDAPDKTIKRVGKELGFTQDEQDGILQHFILGGQLTAGGVLNAVTSFSQTLADADRADTLDGKALRVLALV